MIRTKKQHEAMMEELSKEVNIGTTPCYELNYWKIVKESLEVKQFLMNIITAISSDIMMQERFRKTLQPILVGGTK